jgi:ComF family protein
MFLISTLYKTVLDALFPLSDAEQEMLSLSPKEALEKLPVAPDYSGLAVNLSNTQSVFAYKDERVAKMIWHIKYKKSAHAVRIGGYALWNKLLTTTDEGNRFSGRFGGREGGREPAATSAEVDGVSRKSSFPEPVVVIPMPITNRRRKERGYNQCELLTDQMEELEKTSGCSRFVVRKDVLFRAHHASRQTLKGRHERIESAKGIFEIKAGVVLPELLQSRVIVIDDVITTGSTMYEAIETLKKAGFSNVRAISLAH